MEERFVLDWRFEPTDYLAYPLILTAHWLIALSFEPSALSLNDQQNHLNHLI